MITQEFRPQTFEEVAGQKLNIKILKAIAQNPNSAPKCLIFQGQYGTGKSTCARILAKALNCKHPRADGSPCGKCENCTSDIQNAYFYQEYDSAIVGNVDKIRELRDTFQYDVSDGYKVITFDEAHVVSRAAQSTLLKVIEEVRGRVIFIFATTDVEYLLPTIRSRSLELRFETVGFDDIVQNLRNVATKLDLDVSDHVLKVIADRSMGHMRNAHMLLDKYKLIGEKDFLLTAASSKEIFADYIRGLIRKDKNLVLKSLNDLMRFPLSDLKADYESLLNDMIKVSLGFTVDDEVVTKLVKEDIDPKIVTKLVRICIAKWVMESFENDILFQTAMLVLFQMLGGK